MKNLIFLYGVPGSGKTHISRNMAAELHLPLFEADALKDELRKSTTKEKSPFLFLGTCQAYRQFGELNAEHAIKGLAAVRQALAGRVDEEIQKHDEMIMEGAFLDPKLVQKYGRIILVITPDEQHHRKQFFEHRENTEANLQEFKAARIVQDFLINEAKDLQIGIVEN